jgi:hypothetical protein
MNLSAKIILTRVDDKSSIYVGPNKERGYRGSGWGV